MTTRPIAIILFDSNSGAELPHKGYVFVERPLIYALPRCSTTETPLNHMDLGSSWTRQMLLKQFMSKEFLEACLEDQSTILCAVLQTMLGAWRDIFCESLKFEDDLLSINKDFATDNKGLWHHMDRHRFQLQNLESLNQSLAVAQARGCESFRSKPGTKADAAMKRLEIAFTDLVSQVEREISLLERRLAILASLRSIHESEKAIKQSEYMG